MGPEPFIALIYTREIHFCFEFALLLVRASPMKNRRGKSWLVAHLFHTFAAHSDLVYDVTDTDLMAQNGSTHRRILRFLTNRTRNR